ncbi:MAG: GyrI-like domain-containing protein [Hyphomicrobium sp.]
MFSVIPRVPLRTRMQFIPPMRLACIEARGPIVPASHAAWRGLLDWIERRGHNHPGRGYGQAYRGGPMMLPGHQRYAACIEVPSTWHPCDARYATITRSSGGAYATRRYVGPYSNIGGVVLEIREVWLPKSGVYIDPHRPLLTIFHDDPRNTMPEFQRADVCIPVSVDRRHNAREF